MTLVLNNFKKSIQALDRSLQVLGAPEQMDQLSHEAQEAVKAGVIQNFEVAYEQAWKMMKRWIENNVEATQVDGVTRRELFRLAAEHELIQDVDLWMEFHKARNESSHSYDGDVAQEVLETAQKFLGEVKDLFDRLEQHND